MCLYATLIVPLVLGIAYGFSSLHDRITKKNVSSDELRITNQANLVLRRPHDSFTMDVLEVNPLRQNFLKEIRGKNNLLAVYAKVLFKDSRSPIYIKYSSFTIKPSEDQEKCEDQEKSESELLNGEKFTEQQTIGQKKVPCTEKINLNLEEIQAIELAPPYQLETLISEEDKKKLTALGITFNSKGFLDPGIDFLCKTEMHSNHYQITISKKKEDLSIVFIRVDKTPTGQIPSKELLCVLKWR